MAGEVLDWPASLETIDFPLIFFGFGLFFKRPGQRSGEVGADGFPWKFYENPERNFRRDQQSA